MIILEDRSIFCKIESILSKQQLFLLISKFILLLLAVTPITCIFRQKANNYSPAPCNQVRICTCGSILPSRNSRAMHSGNISEYLFPRKIGGGFADGSSAECRAVPIGSTLLSPLYHVATQVPPLQNAATAELLMAFHILKPVSTYPYFEWKCNYTRARRAHPPFLLIRFFLSLSLPPPSLSLPSNRTLPARIFFSLVTLPFHLETGSNSQKANRILS